MTLQIDNDTLSSETKAAVSLAIENLETVCSSETTADEAYVALTQLNKNTESAITHIQKQQNCSVDE